VPIIMPLFGLGIGMISGGPLSVALYGCKSFVTSGLAVKIGILSAVDDAALFMLLAWFRAECFSHR